MKRSASFYYLFFFLLLITLFVFPVECITASRAGLLLWFNVIVPTLFPFMLISYIIMNSPLNNLMRRPQVGIIGASIYALIIGSISGYPMGALTLSELTVKQHLTPKQANRLMAFCNNPSPMFMIGYVGSELLNNQRIGYLLLAFIYLGNMITASLYFTIVYFMNGQSGSFRRKKSSPRHISKSSSINTNAALSNNSTLQIDQWIFRTAEVLVKVGGYIILFSIPIQLLSNHSSSNPVIIWLISLIDLSNGSNLLANATMNSALQLALIAFLCSFGSLSVMGQTASVIHPAKLSLIHYFIIKVINAGIAGLLTFCLIGVI